MSLSAMLTAVLPVFVLLIAVPVCTWAWRKMNSPGAVPFLLANLFTGLYALGALVEVLQPGLVMQAEGRILKLLGLLPLGSFWFLFVLYLTGSSWRNNRTALFAVSAGTGFLLLLASFSILDSRLPENLLVLPGSIWSLVCAAAALGLLIRHGLQSGEEEGRTAFILSGITALGLTSALVKLLPGDTIAWDPLLLGLAAAGGLSAWTLHANGLLNHPPLNNYRILDSMKEGAALFDSSGRLLGFNPAMASIHPFFKACHLGTRPAGGSREYPELEDLLRAEPVRTLDFPGGPEKGRRVYQVNRSPLRGRVGEPSGHIILLSDITSRVELTEKLGFLARTDELTGIANRRFFFDRLREESDRCTRYGGSFSLAIFDLDHFKRFNDTWGHDVGDAVLKRAVKIWEGCLRTSDLLARYGGEEFGLIIPGAGPSEALQLLERMNRSLQYQDTADGDLRLKITASVGLAQFRPGEDIHSLIRRADEALYEAKHQGRNRICTAPEV